VLATFIIIIVFHIALSTYLLRKKSILFVIPLSLVFLLSPSILEFGKLIRDYDEETITRGIIYLLVFSFLNQIAILYVAQRINKKTSLDNVYIRNLKSYSPTVYLFISILLYFLYYISDPNLYNYLIYGSRIARVEYQYWYLSSLALPLGLIGSSLIGYKYLKLSVIEKVLYLIIVFLICSFSSGRLPLYCFISSFFYSYIQNSNFKKVSLFKLYIFHFLGLLFIFTISVLSRPLKGNSPLLWMSYLSSGQYLEDLDFRSTESDILGYYWYTIDSGWENIVETPLASIYRAILIFFPSSIKFVSKPLDVTQSLWIYLFNHRSLEFENENYFNYFSDYEVPGSVPPTIFGEAYLNGGTLGGTIFLLFFISSFYYVLSKLSVSKYYSPLCGILITSLFYIARGSAYWAFAIFLTSFLLFTISLFLPKFSFPRFKPIRGRLKR
jgi:hypothetical protein